MLTFAKVIPGTNSSPMIKKGILTILIIAIVLDTTSLYQVLKLPFLFQHYTEHKSLDHNIGFGDFLAMHYLNSDGKHHDDEKDTQLPFKKADAHECSILYVPSPIGFTLGDAPTWSVKTAYGPDRPQGHFNTTLGALFRPPRA